MLTVLGKNPMKNAISLTLQSADLFYPGMRIEISDSSHFGIYEVREGTSRTTITVLPAELTGWQWLRMHWVEFKWNLRQAVREAMLELKACFRP